MRYNKTQLLDILNSVDKALLYARADKVFKLQVIADKIKLFLLIE